MALDSNWIMDVRRNRTRDEVGAEFSGNNGSIYSNSGPPGFGPRAGVMCVNPCHSPQQFVEPDCVRCQWPITPHYLSPERRGCH